MLKCWEQNPSDRPTFANLKDTMNEMERNNRVSMGYELVTNSILYPFRAYLYMSRGAGSEACKTEFL